MLYITLIYLLFICMTTASLCSRHNVLANVSVFVEYYDARSRYLPYIGSPIGMH